MRSLTIATYTLAALVVSACEAIPTVYMSVQSSTEDRPVVFVKTDRPEPDLDVLVERGVPSALISVTAWTDDCMSNAATVDGLNRSANGTGSVGHGNGDDWPVVMRTSGTGRARYAELRLRPLPIIPFAPVRRCVTVSARGHQTRTFEIEFTIGQHILEIPLKRE